MQLQYLALRQRFSLCSCTCPFWSWDFRLKAVVQTVRANSFGVCYACLKGKGGQFVQIVLKCVLLFGWMFSIWEGLPRHEFMPPPPHAVFFPNTPLFLGPQNYFFGRGKATWRGLPTGKEGIAFRNGARTHKGQYSYNISDRPPHGPS